MPLVSTTAFVAAMASTGDARAQGCWLTRSPVLMPFVPGASEELQCAYDADGNGLDDEVEEQIASCFAPIFDVDPEEPESSWGPDEPAVLWTIHRRESNPHEDKLTIKYAAFWRKDGGFVAGGGIECGNSHDGDSGHVTVTATVQRWNSFFMTTLESIHGDGSDVGYTDHDPLMHREFSHPVVYPSAGKHHWYLWPGSYSSPVSVLVTDAHCNDEARGGRKIRLQDLTRFRHGYNSRQLRPALVTAMHVDGDGTNWPNMCSFLRFGKVEPATRFQGYYLDDFGFPGFTYDIFFPDSSEDVTTPSEKMSLGLTADPDGDGLREVFDVHLGDDGWVVDFPVDPCSLGAGGDDPDGDNLVGPCDPDPAWFSPYVAGGSNDFPNAAYHFGIGPWRGHDGVTVSWPRDGFLDRDRDGQVEGEDRCPSLPDWLDDANAWGQDQNWPPGTTWKPTSPMNVNLGQLQRGNRCDPYPVATPEPSYPSNPCSHCGPATPTSQGADTLPITNTVTEGLSLNDTRRDNPNWVVAAETLDAQSYRCACRPKVQYGSQTIEECLNDPSSDCYRGDVREAAAGVAPGHGWRRVDRNGCSRNAASYCGSYPIKAKPFEPQTNAIGWAWRDERDNYGSSSATPHFAPDDFRVGESNDSAFKYVFWTQTDVSEPRFSSNRRAESLFYDPETMPDNTELLDVDSVESRRLRAGHSSVATYLKGQRDVICPGIACEGIDALIREIMAFGPGWHPDPVNWSRERFNPRLLTSSGTFAEEATWVVKPAQENRVKVALVGASDHPWLTSEQGRGVLLAAPSNTQPVDRIASVETDFVIDEPGILWVEKGNGAAKWALLRPVGASEQQLEYAPAFSGTLDGVGPTASLVQEYRSSGAAIVDFDTGALWAFHPTLQTWMRAQATLEPLVGRSGAAMAFVDKTLFVLGGTDATGVKGDAWAIDAFTGEQTPLELGLPPRTGALLTLATDRPALLFVGGVDVAGNAHDDVWVMEGSLATELPAARLLRPDTADADSFSAKNTVVLGASDGRDLVSWTVSGTSLYGLDENVRSEEGWVPRGTGGEPAAPACEEADALGGQLCSVSSHWWATAGVRACATDTTTGECRGTEGHLVTETQLPGVTNAVAVAADGDTLWVVRPHALERWLIATDKAPMRLARQELDGKGRDVAAAQGVALVASNHGVRTVRATTDGFTMSDPIGLCGQPVRVARVADSVWAVATTLGHALVGVRNGAPEVLSQFWLFPSIGQDTPMAIAIGTDPATMEACDAVAGPLEGLAPWIRKSSGMVGLDGDRLIAAWGAYVFDIDVSRPEAPEARSDLRAWMPIGELRADRWGQRAYGIAGLGAHEVHPVFDIEGALSLAQEHNVGDWVERRDADRWSAFVRNNGRVVVAEVLR